MTGQKQKQYGIRGLDLRSNRLLRKDGTASDCRNVLLDENRNLVKRPDFTALNVPRGTDGETGEFLDKIPYPATIIDILRYKTYDKEEMILACAIIVEGLLGEKTYNMKFYRYDRDANTVEFIPFTKFTETNTLWGRFTGYKSSQHEGKFTSATANNNLYFCGKRPENVTTDSTDTEAAGRYSLVPIVSYDGATIKDAGVPNVVESLPEDDTAFTLDPTQFEYNRFVAMSFDDQEQLIFGDFRVRSAGVETATPNQDTILTGLEEFYTTTDIARQVSARITSAAGVYPENSVLDIVRQDQGDLESLADGQMMYVVAYETIVETPPDEKIATYISRLFRFRVVDVTSTTCRITEVAEASLTDFNTWTPTDLVIPNPTEISLGVYTDTYMSNVFYGVYRSESNYSFGYTYVGLMVFAREVGHRSIIRYPTLRGTSTLTETRFIFPEIGITYNFEDMYAESTVKLPPPLGRSVTSYVGQLLVSDHEQFYFSDISRGGTPEAFVPGEQVPVGDIKEDGEFRGVLATPSVLAAFREKNAYYISGNIFTGNYTSQSYRSTKIGCTDPKSIVLYREAGLFMSKRGVYAAYQGSKMGEVSDIIEPMFTDDALGLELDLQDTKGLVDFKRENILFFMKSDTEGVPGYVLVFNYYYKEWFLLSELDATRGFEIFDNDKIYTSDGNDIYVESSTSRLSRAYYRSNFNTMGEPGLEKKFHQVLVYTPDLGEDSEIEYKAYKNWNTVDTVTDAVKTLPAGELDLKQRMRPQHAKSFAFQVESPEGNPFKVSGYEFYYAYKSTLYKDDD